MRKRFDAMIGSAVLAFTPIFAGQELRFGNIAFPSGDQEFVIVIDDSTGEDYLVADDYGPLPPNVGPDDEGQGEPVVTAESDTTLAPEEAAQVVLVQDVRTDAGAVSGTIANNSSRPVRDVQLLVRQSWLWNDERHPGSDPPGRTLTYVVNEPVAAHATRTFRYELPPLPQRDDGHFDTRVVVGGFTEVGL